MWKTASALNNTEQYTKLLEYLDTHINNVNPKTAKDSLDIADLYYYEFQGYFYTGNYSESIKSVEKGLPFCNNITSKRGKNVKGALYYKRAYGESNLNFPKRAENTMKTAIKYLTDDYKPNLDYLVDAYVFLSTEAAYHGNLAEAKRNIRFAEKIYRKHKKHLDKTKSHRYEVILDYRKIYLLYKLAEKKEDSLELTKVIKSLEASHASPSFQENERIYYSTALNHVGDWYISYKADSLIDKKHLEHGTYYIDKSIDLIENKNYPGNSIVFKYNKCKALTKGNKLIEANTLILDLLNSMAETDGRKPFFLAQKALIKAKLSQKDSALHIFHTVIEEIHSDTTKLAKAYNNFKPSKVYGHTRLIRRVAEKLETFYKDDITVQKTIAKLYHLAFIQFENSYAKTKFNPEQNQLLRKIIYGVLATKEKGTNVKGLTTNTLLSCTETMMNQMTWQRFYQNRYTNNLPALDSLKHRHLTLRTILTAAKKQQNIHKEDSILNLINLHIDFTNTMFPNLELLSSKEFKLSELQNNLATDELVVKYILFEKELAIFSITANNLTWKLQPWTTKEIDLVNNYVTAIKNRKYNSDDAVSLANYILPTIDKNIKKIIFNPDGELYKIPFETLQATHEFLAIPYEIRYTSNLKFIHLDTETTKETTLAIYAPTYEGNTTAFATRSAISNLEGAKAEAKIIGKLFPSKIYMGKNVSKQQFIETAHTAKILHLAMHAEINNKEAGLSRLLFNKNNTDEDDLYLEELYALNLRADLAVLSACNTGLGKENAGRSMESFQRAFTFAGVPATVASLWEVPDQSTSEIMESFYQYLKKGVSKSKALQNAKLDYIVTHQGTKLSQPYYWAGFILYGDQTAVTQSISTIVWILLISSVLLVFIVLFSKKKRKSRK
ncbi:CHAT domain-containing protein [uncultured Kordia sp.]|uniref:CHAT domain-containing protein n=1 Tax=uncultured Kordia sp. TaxID=507699 RepID=UPI00262688F6|nr:CHAT domain-containing protein [uncultured Kordia sp.]